MISAVLFDLDDTLFEQREWLAGAWTAVAEAPGAPRGPAFYEALVTIAAEGSDRGQIIDRALEHVGAEDVAIEPLVSAFRRWTPDALTPYPGAREAVDALRARVPVALVSDGDPGLQRHKLSALAMAHAFDAVVLSDELGRSFRKPHPAPFLTAARLLGVDPSCCVMVGDRPDKDVCGALAAGLIGTVRVRTGEYALQPDGAGCLTSVPDIAAAAVWLLDRVVATRRARR